MGTAAAALLGVERSLAGRLWRARLADDRLAMAIAQRLGVPEIVGRVLAGRGVCAEEAERFLRPTLREMLPSPLRVKDMDAAVARLAAAVERAEPIAVFGDYDVDGATSTALLQRFFAAVGVPVRVYIPDRLTEGYGPSATALRRLAAEGARVVLTVDCGTAAFAALDAGAAAGLDVIVVDHHKAEPSLPRAFAVVNPNRLDDASGLGELAAVGVVFMLVVALNARLRELGWYAPPRREPDLLEWLDLVALGTVCDMVPLTGLNRCLVAQGIKMLAQRRNAGLAALSDVAGIRERPGAFHLGFLLGPRVNAGGRVGEAALGARLLCTSDPAEAAALAARLDVYNRERQAIEEAVLRAAVEQIEAAGPGPGPVLIAAGAGWHPGVLGIVASRLVARYGRPACVVALDGGRGKGSGRSVPGFDLGAAVIAARQAGLLEGGGGHPMAAGFSLPADRLAELRAFLDERCVRASLGPAVPSLGLDGVLTVRAATLELLDFIDRAGPYGSGHAEPRFVFAGARIARADVVGERHVRVVVADGDGARLKGIAFRAFESGLAEPLLAHRGRTLHVAGHLRRDSWQGREDVQLFVDDAAPVGQGQ